MNHPTDPSKNASKLRPDISREIHQFHTLWLNQKKVEDVMTFCDHHWVSWEPLVS